MIRVSDLKYMNLEEVYPNKGETKQDFIKRFMSVTKDEYPDAKQRYAVALSYWNKKNKKVKESVQTISKAQEDFFKDSKIRNSRGELIVCYHGSSASNIKAFRENNGLIWFALSKAYADSFGLSRPENTKAYYLNVTNPLRVGKTDESFEDVLAIVKKNKSIDGVVPSEHALLIAKKLNVDPKELVDIFNTIDITKSRRRLYQVINKPRFKELLVNAGYDGVIAIEEGNTTIGCVAANQIKLITNEEPTNSVNVDESKKKRKDYTFTSCAGNVEYNVNFFNSLFAGNGETDSGSLAESEKVNEELHDTLNPVLWEDDKTLKSVVRAKLLYVVNKFRKGLLEDNIDIKVKDAVLVGSNVNYNYTDNSDLDLHIIVDTESAGDSQDIYKVLLDEYRKNFKNKYTISIKKIPLEVYIENDNIGANSNGIYSIITNAWIKEPSRDLIPEIDKEEFDKQFKEWEDRYKDLISNSKLV